MRWILASGSPRRRELLERAGVAFEVRPAAVDEWHDASWPVAELCEKNAELKARAAARVGEWVLGADTLVHLDGEPLGKPADRAEARAMLLRLSGREHVVCTGVCLLGPDGRAETFHETTRVRFRELTPGVIDRYLEHVDPLDKAGSYGIQDHGDLLVEGIVGSYENVMGLPIERVLERLDACSEVAEDLESG